MIRKLLSNHPQLVQRALEILPGFISWNLILFPIWGAFVFPVHLAYFVLLFNVFWFYKSAFTAIAAIASHYKIQAAERFDWLSEVKVFKDWHKVHHIIIIPTVNEPIHILERTVESLKKQTWPSQQMTIVVAMEKKIDAAHRTHLKKALTKKFGKTFGHLYFTEHQLAPGEVVGKSSNERYAGIWVKKKLVDQLQYDIRYLTISSCDADHIYHHKHFAYLAYKFLDNPNRYNRFWQPAVMFYNNYWRLPALTRVANTFGTVWNIAQLSRTDRLLNCANYSTSLKLIHKVGYWDPDVIPEDYRIFFKSFFKLKGQVEVEPLYLPLYADAAESTSWWRTMVNQYEQFKRWAWGVSDDSYIIKHYFLSPDIPFWDKTVRVLRIIEDHFLWPVNWFIVTLGVNIPILVNSEFIRTSLGYNLPKMSSAILTGCLVFLIILLIIDARRRPQRPQDMKRWRAWLIPLEFTLMPLVGFIFTALPGLDAHTRLMLGRYLEYRVTEKV
jgi:hypothetical protein